MTKKKEEKLTKYCRGHPQLTWLIYGEGMFDVAITVVAKNLAEIEHAYDELYAAFGECLQNSYVTFASRIYHYKHNYLYDAYDYKELILGEEYLDIRLDEKDQALVQLLTAQPLLSLVDLSQKMGSTPKGISYRMKSLLQRKIIVSFRAKINTRLLGFDRYKVFLTLALDNHHRQQDLLKSFLACHPHVIYITKSLGMHNLEFEIIVKNANHLHEIMRGIKEQFGDCIINYQTNLYYAEPLIEYYPYKRRIQ